MIERSKLIPVTSYFTNSEQRIRCHSDNFAVKIELQTHVWYDKNIESYTFKS